VAARKRSRGKRRASAKKTGHERLGLGPSSSVNAAGVAAVPLPSAGARARGRAASIAAHRAMPIVALVGIYCASVVIYSVVAGRHILADMFPDEMLYAKLSQGFANGDGLTWRGAGWGIPPVWPLLLSVVWHFGSTPDGYVLGKVLGAALASTAIVPTWLLGRELVGPRLALLPAALTVVGAWMCMTSYLASENLAYPLATAALASTVVALRRPGTRWIWIALVFGIAAAIVRTQLLVLPVILVVALVIDVVRQPRSERRARIDMRPRWLWTGLIAAVVVGLAAFIVKPDLTHYDLLAHHASIGKVAKSTGQFAISSVVLFGIIPAIVAIALMTTKANWRDERTGPVLATLLAGAVVLFPVNGRFGAWATQGPVDRYNMYLAPLVMLAFVLARGRLRRNAAVATAIVMSVGLLLVPISPNYVVEQPALYGTEKRIHDLGSFFAHHMRLGLVIFALPIVLFVLVSMASPRRQRAGFAVAVTCTFVVMLLQTSATHHAVFGAIQHSRSFAAAPQLDWVDRHVDSRAALLNLGQPQQIGAVSYEANRDLYTEFFNRRVNEAYSTVAIGGGCIVTLQRNGSLVRSSGTGCRPWPRYLVVEDGPYKATLYGSQVLAKTKYHGTLVKIPPGNPRILGLAKAPCDQNGCRGEATVGLFTDSPGHLEFTFSAAPSQYLAQIGNKLQKLRPNRTNTLTVPVSKGGYTYHVPVSWTTPQGSPALKSVVLEAAGQRTRLL
jgi:hypothetical protein